MCVSPVFTLTFTTFWAFSADGKLMIFFPGDNLYEMSNPVFFGKNKKNISKSRLLKILPRVLSVNRF